MTDALVSTAWVARHARDAGLRIFEVSLEQGAYPSGHLPGAAAVDWKRDLIEREDESSGLVIDPQRFAALASRLGLQPDDTLVFYGDQGGRHAARALWTFEYYRHPGALHLMDGGREAWAREGRPLTQDAPAIEPSAYPQPPAPDETIRATRAEIAAALGSGNFVPLDTRTRGEHDGADIRAARGGRIPGSQHCFWKDALTDDAFRPEAELALLYAGLPLDATVATYCQLGVRAAHTWFVLRHLLDYPNVKNYDGSWQEWGNLTDTPIENETAP